MVQVHLSFKALLSGFIFVVVLPVLITLAALLFYKKEPLQQPLIFISMVCSVFYIIGILLSLNNYIKFENDQLLLKAGVHTLKASLDGHSPKLSQIANEVIQSYQPKLKVAGTSFPYYHTGRFTLKNGKQAFVLIIGDYKTLTLIETVDTLVVTNASYEELANAIE